MMRSKFAILGLAAIVIACQGGKDAAYRKAAESITAEAIANHI